jgi:hypothetical protein
MILANALGEPPRCQGYFARPIVAFVLKGNDLNNSQYTVQLFDV